MSVGGRVVETIVLDDRVWVNTVDDPRGRNQCAIYVERTPESRTISPGDVVWWQGAWAFWTPVLTTKERPFVERKLKRIGFSGVPKPVTQETNDDGR